MTENESGGVPVANEIKPADLDAMSQSLTFHASFDKGADADFALGDPRIYSNEKVAGQQKPVPSEAGLGNPALAIAPEGKFGQSLEFTAENSHIVYIKRKRMSPIQRKTLAGR
jgi:hypothetical protein